MQNYRIRITVTGLAVVLALLGVRLSDRQFSQTVWGYSYEDDKQQWGFRHYARLSEDQVAEVFRSELRGPRASLGMIEPRKLARHLLNLCDRYQFDPALILSLIHVESRFQLLAVSKAGAQGLLQLLPDTAFELSKTVPGLGIGRVDLADPYTNISLGVAYLAFLRERYDGSFEHLLMGYNLGPGTTDRIPRKKIAKISRQNLSVKPVKKRISKIPIEVVIPNKGITDYIQRVNKRAQEFRRLKNV